MGEGSVRRGLLGGERLQAGDQLLTRFPEPAREAMYLAPVVASFSRESTTFIGPSSWTKQAGSSRA